MDYHQIFSEIHQELEPEKAPGQVASYIPELAKVDPTKYGVFLKTLEDSCFALGDAREAFSAQSITKVFSLALAMQLQGDSIFDRVDVEPSGTSFNSLVLLEYEDGIPRNPFINSGALVIADILVSNLQNPKEGFLQFVRELTQDPHIEYSKAIAQSEAQERFRNRALANMLRSFGNIVNPVEEVLDFYYYQCSLLMSCQQLAEAFLPYANAGKTLE